MDRNTSLIVLASMKRSQSNGLRDSSSTMMPGTESNQYLLNLEPRFLKMIHAANFEDLLPTAAKSRSGSRQSTGDSPSRSSFILNHRSGLANSEIAAVSDSLLAQSAGTGSSGQVNSGESQTRERKTSHNGSIAMKLGLGRMFSTGNSNNNSTNNPSSLGSKTKGFLKKRNTFDFTGTKRSALVEERTVLDQEEKQSLSATDIRLVFADAAKADSNDSTKTTAGSSAEMSSLNTVNAEPRESVTGKTVTAPKDVEHDRGDVERKQSSKTSTKL
jgi:hypothetical protein